MCRPKSAGGRRCPAHSTPEYRENRNARRRAAYASRKGLNSQHSMFTTGFNYDENTFIPANNLIIKGETTITPNGLTRTTQTGKLVELGLLPPQTVAGNIAGKDFSNNVEELGFYNPNTYQDPNFPRHAPDYQYTRDTPRYRLSQQVLQNCTDDEKDALKAYTSTIHETINEGLYNLEEYPEGSPEDKIEVQSHKLTEDKYPRYQHIPEEQRTQHAFRNYEAIMNQALSKGIKQQRILYRGISKQHLVHLTNYLAELHDYRVEPLINSFIENEFKPGKVYEFDSFLSTSANKSITTSYGKDGVVFEILTSQGLDLAANSAYDHEEEVLLPSKSRFQIVGLHRLDKQTYQGHSISYGGSKVPYVVQMVQVDEKGNIV